MSIYLASKSVYEVFNWYDVNIRQPVMKPLNNLIQKTKKDLVTTVKKGFNKVKTEIKEIKRKGPVKYLQDKTRQLQKTYKSYKKTYKTRFKPVMQKYVKTQTHKYLKPIAKHPVTKWLVKNVPGAKKITNGLSWAAKKLGIW